MAVERTKVENLGFAFNDFDFSDRILRLGIIQDNGCHPKVVTLRISSPILASRSPLFHRLFKNRMRESQQKNDAVSLAINASEVAAFMELLNFMYGNTLDATSSRDLISVLIVADKFEVTSCMRQAIRMLLELPMSLEDAIAYLRLPWSVLESEIAQPLVDEAKKYIHAVRYKNFTNLSTSITTMLASGLSWLRKRHVGLISPEGRYKMKDSGAKKTFGFAFNDFDFADRTLSLKIIPDEEDSIDGARIITLRISSPILASNSPFFHKLFKNGMRESQQENGVYLTINAYEKAAFINLLNFIYGETLGASSAPDLINVLMVADKFGVSSCMKCSVKKLLKLIPMSLEDAVSILELPSSVLVSELVQPLFDAAKKHVVGYYKNFAEFQEVAMELPLSIVEVVLEGAGLQVVSEDVVFDFVLKWARVLYPVLEERREILTKRVARFVSLPNMSYTKLKEVLVCPDFDHEQVSKLVMDALFSKAELTCGQYIFQGSEDLTPTNLELSRRRVYNRRFFVHTDHCYVYLDLKKEECADLFTSRRQFDSPHFCLGGKRLYLSAQYREKEDSFCLFLRSEKSSETCDVDFELEVMKKSSNEFESNGNGNNLMLYASGCGIPDLLRIPWTKFMSDNNDYFIGGVLHIRAMITLVRR